MDVSNLYAGMEVRNYKELCELLGVDGALTGGNSKKVHLKNMERYFRYSKKGYKFIIEEVYKVPLPPNSKVRRHDSIVNTHPSKASHITNYYGHDTRSLSLYSGIVVQWRCSVCGCLYDNSISKEVSKKYIRCKVCSKSKGERDVMKVLDRCKVKYINEVTFPDLKGKALYRFDYGVLNDDNEVIGLIEYDGEYHDINSGTMSNDLIKNEYCENNNIPLLRIHHSEYKDMKFKILTFIYGIVRNDSIVNELYRMQVELRRTIDKQFNSIERNINKVKAIRDVMNIG